MLIFDLNIVYQVAQSQIASLVAGVFSNTAVAENKVTCNFTAPTIMPKKLSQLLSF